MSVSSIMRKKFLSQIGQARLFESRLIKINSFKFATQAQERVRPEKGTSATVEQTSATVQFPSELTQDQALKLLMNWHVVYQHRALLRLRYVAVRYGYLSDEQLQHMSSLLSKPFMQHALKPFKNSVPVDPIITRLLQLSDSDLSIVKERNEQNAQALEGCRDELLANGTLSCRQVRFVGAILNLSLKDFRINGNIEPKDDGYQGGVM